LEELLLFAFEALPIHPNGRGLPGNKLAKGRRHICLLVLAEDARHVVERHEAVLVWTFNLIEEALSDTTTVHSLPDSLTDLSAFSMSIKLEPPVVYDALWPRCDPKSDPLDAALRHRPLREGCSLSSHDQVSALVVCGLKLSDHQSNLVVLDRRLSLDDLFRPILEATEGHALIREVSF